MHMNLYVTYLSVENNLIVYYIIFAHVNKQGHTCTSILVEKTRDHMTR